MFDLADNFVYEHPEMIDMTENWIQSGCPRNIF